LKTNSLWLQSCRNKSRSCKWALIVTELTHLYSVVRSILNAINIHFIEDPYFIWQLCLLFLAATSQLVWAAGWIEYVNTINDATGSDNCKMSDIIMTLYFRNNI
jgi:hypothetical protein